MAGAARSQREGCDRKDATSRGPKMEQWLSWWPWVLLAIVLALALWGFRPSPGPAPILREATEALLDLPGRRLLAALRYAIKDRWILYPLISSDRLLQPESREGLPGPVMLDFVLGEKDSSRPRLAIWLERDSGNTEFAAWEEALSAAGLAVLRVPVAEDFDVDVLRQAIEKGMS